MSCILAIETSSPILSIAFQQDGKPFVESTLQGYSGHVENLIPLIDQMLKNQSVSISEVDTFLLGRGPGSFTGLRVGFATVKALQTVQKRNCYGAASLDMIAEHITLKDGSVLAVGLDAHRSRIYSKFFVRQQNEWKPQSEIQLHSIEEFMKALPENGWLAGDALLRYREILEPKQKLMHWNFLPEPDGYPRAASLLSLFQKKDSRIQKLQTPEDFLPLYLRLSEAEEKKNEHAPAS